MDDVTSGTHDKMEKLATTLFALATGTATATSGAAAATSGAAGALDTSLDYAGYQQREREN